MLSSRETSIRRQVQTGAVSLSACDSVIEVMLVAGQKIARESYTQIAAEIGLPPESVLFVTDVVKEAAAATAAGMQVTGQGVKRIHEL